MRTLLVAALAMFPAAAFAQVQPTADLKPPADVIYHHAKVISLDGKSRIFEAVAIKDGRIAGLGDDDVVFAIWKGADTKVVDLDGRAVMPGLHDSHTHVVGAATSEINEPIPELKSIKDVLDHIRAQAAKKKEGEWIVLRFAFPTRLNEARFPTKAELDEAAPKHPVLYHSGPAGICNSAALKVSGVTKDTPNPTAGVVVKDAVTGEPTGMLRNAYGVLKGVPAGGGAVSPADRKAAVKKLIAMYNAHGITSICERTGDRASLDLFAELRAAGELTVRVGVARTVSPAGTRDEIIKQLENLPGKDKKGGPTGTGDEWIRVGPIKLFLDGGMLNGTAFMREPWPKGETYQVTEDNYRGLQFIPSERLAMFAEEAARRGWQVTAHTAGEGAMDVLLDAYDAANKAVPISELRFCITHANFPSQRNFEICKRLNVCADVQPAWLYKDGATLHRVLGKERVRWFQPYKSWLKYTTIGGGSDHMIKLDPIKSTNPWSPWLGVFTAVTRLTERGGVLVPDERLTREEALRLYTINNAYLGKEEKIKGSLEQGKLADLIVLDRDPLNCRVEELPDTEVLLTVVGGKVVWEKKE